MQEWVILFSGSKLLLLWPLSPTSQLTNISTEQVTEGLRLGEVGKLECKEHRPSEYVNELIPTTDTNV